MMLRNQSKLSESPTPSNAPSVLEIPYADPVQLFAPLAGEVGAVFFDSATTPGLLARYSFLAAEPASIFTTKGATKNPFAELQQLMQPHRFQAHPNLPPWQGGIAGFFSYDLCHHIERLPHAHDDMGFSDLAVGFYHKVAAFDHLQRQAWIFAPDLTQAERFRNRLFNAPLLPEIPVFQAEITSDFTQEIYEQAIQRVIDYIYAGDIYQANMTRRFQATLPKGISTFDLYRRLRTVNPAPFAGFMHFEGCTLASASPERFLLLKNGFVETRPIKGTRPRGKTAAEDQALATELRQALKDNAENIMIVDLLRNDLSRVCLPHTVKTPNLLAIESYQTVHHLVSTITGQLRPGLDAFDLLQATFPGGSITGAPKVRAMEIIAELEPTTRGPYCGSMGYIGFDGTMDTNIVIRTFAIKDRQITFQTGGGIVADSDPLAEYLETETKALGLKHALTP